MWNTAKTSKRILAVALSVTLAACGGGGGDEAAAPPSTGGGGGGTPSNNPPSISGSPPSEVVVGQVYSFSPSASDPDGDNLSFSIGNAPSWMTFFDTSTGRIEGTPEAGDEGTYDSITVSVSDGTTSTSLNPFEVVVNAAASPPPPPNNAPAISGSPASDVEVGTSYSFVPNASDADGDSLTFTIQNQPSWINSFNSNTGRISGTPTAGDVGTYNGIRITVSDGTDSDTLGPFSITVNQISTGSVSLSWDAPTLNEDGSPLTDLAGYALYYGTQSGVYPNSISIDSPGITTYVVDGLLPDNYYFVAVAVKSNGIESDYSNEVLKVVQ